MLILLTTVRRFCVIFWVIFGWFFISLGDADTANIQSRDIGVPTGCLENSANIWILLAGTNKHWQMAKKITRSIYTWIYILIWFYKRDRITQCHVQPFLYSSKCASFKTKDATENTSCKHANTNIAPLIPGEKLWWRFRFGF